MPLSYPGYSVIHDNSQYIFVFAINYFFYEILCTKSREDFSRILIFNSAFLYFLDYAQELNKSICDLNISQIDTQSRSANLGHL